MYVTTLIKYDDCYTVVDKNIRLEIVRFSVGSPNNNIVWVRKVDSNDGGEFPLISEFVTKYCERLNNK